MGADVTLVSSAEETAKDVYRALATHDLQRTAGTPPEHHFVATGDAGQFEALARRFLGPEVLSVRHVDHVAAQYPTGSLARITPEMIAAAQNGGERPRISNFVGSGGTGGSGL